MTGIEKDRNSPGISRRTVLKGAAAGMVGVAIPTTFGIRQAYAQSRKLRVVTSATFKLADAWKATSEPERDATYLRATWGILQDWKQKHPDVEMQFEEVPWDQVTPTAILAAQSGTEADVIQINDLNIPKLARGGFLLPLDDFSDQWDDYNQHLLRGIASFDGKIYAAPWMTDCRHEMYWKSDFEKAGISEPASTWSEFADQLVAIKETGVANPYAFWAGNSVHTPTQSLLAPLWMLGGDVLDAEGRAKLNTPEMTEVLNFYSMLMNDKQVASKDLIALSDGGAYGDQIVSHKVAAAKQGAWIWQTVTAAGVGNEVGYFRTPRPSADAPDATLSGFWAYQLPARTGVDDAQQELAAEFALHMTSSEAQAMILAQTDGQLPTRPSATQSPQAAEKDDAWRFQAAYAAEAGRGMPPAADAGLLFDQMRTAFQRFLTGEASAADALTAAESAYNSQVV
jgi:arabinogalactan oligomer / maltooligosaccharide transport system substrate-binding protein